MNQGKTSTYDWRPILAACVRNGLFKASESVEILYDIMTQKMHIGDYEIPKHVVLCGPDAIVGYMKGIQERIPTCKTQEELFDEARLTLMQPSAVPETDTARRDRVFRESLADLNDDSVYAGVRRAIEVIVQSGVSQ